MGKGILASVCFKHEKTLTTQGSGTLQTAFVHEADEEGVQLRVFDTPVDCACAHCIALAMISMGLNVLEETTEESDRMDILAKLNEMMLHKLMPGLLATIDLAMAECEGEAGPC